MGGLHAAQPSRTGHVHGKTIFSAPSGCSCCFPTSACCGCRSTIVKLPEFFGFPFFYWYQLAWVPLTSLLIFLVYRSVGDDE